MGRENSNCLDSVVKILCTYAAIGYRISTSVPIFIERIIADHASYNHHYEVAWVLWLARSLQVRLSAEASARVMRMENDICALLACHLRGRRLLTGRGQATSWIGAVSEQDLYRDHWLLIYEGGIRPSWQLQGAPAAVRGNQFFAALSDEDVSFYDTRASNRALKLPGIEQHIRRALGGRKRALLPGAILATAHGWNIESEYEELGENYGGGRPSSLFPWEDESDVEIPDFD